MAQLSDTYLRGDANLRAYYKLSSTADELGTYNLTNSGSATFVTGKYGNAVQVSQTGPKYLYVNNDLGGLAGGSTLSLSFWVKLTTDATYYTLELSDISTRVRFQVLYGGNICRFIRVREGVGVATTSGSVTTDATKFHHIVATYAGGTLSIYHDNVLVGTASQTGNGSSGGSEEFVIGGVTGDGYSNSIIDDFSAFDRELTASDRSALFTESGGAFIYELL